MFLEPSVFSCQETKGLWGRECLRDASKVVPDPPSVAMDETVKDAWDFCFKQWRLPKIIKKK